VRRTQVWDCPGLFDRRFEELAARLEQRIDDGIEEIETSIGLLTESINELSGSVREIARTLARLARSMDCRWA
jgi:hypothetical protein